MSREHTPRPGATWETTVHRAETVVQDDMLGCRYCGVHADEHGNRYHHRIGLHDWHPMTLEQFRELHGQPVPSAATVVPDGEEPAAEPRNRRQRRDQARANRQKGQPR